MKSRAAVKDVGRVLGFTPAETDALAKLIPNQPNFSLTVQQAIEKVADVRRLYETEERYQQLLDYATALEGLSRHTGVHAAGVVIAPGPLDDYVPVCTQESKGAGNRENGGDERVIVTQYDMNCLEKAGMLKMDFLGLTTLTVIHDALNAIERAHRRSARTSTRSRTTTRRRTGCSAMGRTVGVFQFESPLATDMLRAMRCDRFDDLVASNALMRPGPLDAGMHKVYQRRKRGEEPIVYALPELAPILEATYGVITYQEQVMRIAQQLAGISLAEADVLRKAVGKKDAELIRQELGKFIEKAVARGHDRAHHRGPRRRRSRPSAGTDSTSRTPSPTRSSRSRRPGSSATSPPSSWRRCCRPSIGDTDSVVKFINEARELGIEVLAPDVNESGYKFTVVGDHRIRFGLGAIRNVGRTAIDSILAARAERPFTSLFDLCERIDLRHVQQAGLRGADPLGGAGLARRAPRAVRRRSWTRRSRRRRSSRTSGRPARRPSLATSAVRQRPGTATGGSPTLAERGPDDGIRAADAGEGDPRLLYFRASAGAVPRRVRTLCHAYSCQARDVAGRAAQHRCGRHRHQAAGQQEIRRRVRAVDSGGFFRIFRIAGVSRGVVGAWGTVSGPTFRCWSGAGTRSVTRERTTRRSSSSR